jgi:uncharacterized protein with PIN domain
MNCFFDTSAIVKLFQEEEGSDVVEALVRDTQNEVWVSDLTKVEYLSSLYRKHREKKLTSEDVEALIDLYDDQVDEFFVEHVGPAVLEEAEEMMKQYGKDQGLRTLDAIQIGTCDLLYEEGWQFICADNIACKVAELNGVSFLNPLDP